MDRLDRLRHEIQQQGWDAAWVTKAANRQYLSGFTGSAGWVLVPAQGKPVLVTDGRYTQQARLEAGKCKVIITAKDPLAVMTNWFKSKKIKKLAFEDDDVSVAAWKKVKSLNPKLRGTGIQSLIEQIRAVKDAEEVNNIKKAIKIAQKAFEEVAERIRPGISERGLAFEMEKCMFKGGSEGLAFPTIVASGPRSSLPHGQPTDRKLRSGDLVILDFGCTVKGYHSDLTRTVVVGKINQKQKELYKIVKKAQKISQKLIFSGQKCSDSDKKAREIFKEAKLEKYFVHSLGHGLGQDVHELPRLSGSSKDEFKTGMVVTCEPGIYLPGWGGVRIEDDLLVQAKVSLWLSQSPEELRVVGKR
jgi:Xaa-Pro aminopeptidase